MEEEGGELDEGLELRGEGQESKIGGRCQEKRNKS